MDINKQIVDQRIRKIVAVNAEWFADAGDENNRFGRGFLLLGVMSYLGMDSTDAMSLITDGTDDSGIDAIHIGDLVDFEFPVTIFQSKYKLKLENDYNFPANAVEKATGTVSRLFNPSSEITSNAYLTARVEDIRSLMSDGYIPSVKCVLMNNGPRWNNEGDQHIANAGFPEDQVSFEHFNHNDIVGQLTKKAPVNELLTLTGRSFIEDFNFKRVLVGKIGVNEIAMLMENHQDAILEKNIRKYLGLQKNRVNEGIKNTLVSDKRSNFYFFNNGVTMVCSNFKHNGLAQDNWQVRVEDLQIIKGGQTCKTIHQTIRDNPDIDFSQAFVLVRLYELDGQDNDELLSDITLATNSQNPVDLRDLRSNDKLQKALETAVHELGYVYKTKRDNVTITSEAIPSSVAAEAVLSIWRQKPHVAKFHQNELFGKFYHEVFDSLNSAQLVMAVLIFRFCDSRRKRSLEAHTPYSQNFMSMLIGELLLSELNIPLNKLTHQNFQIARDTFEQEREKLYQEASTKLVRALNTLCAENYGDIELRRLSAMFRRGDLLNVLKEQE